MKKIPEHSLAFQREKSPNHKTCLQHSSGTQLASLRRQSRTRPLSVSKAPGVCVTAAVTCTPPELGRSSLLPPETKAA